MQGSLVTTFNAAGQTAQFALYAAYSLHTQTAHFGGCVQHRCCFLMQFVHALFWASPCISNAKELFLHISAWNISLKSVGLPATTNTCFEHQECHIFSRKFLSFCIGFYSLIVLFQEVLHVLFWNLGLSPMKLSAAYFGKDRAQVICCTPECISLPHIATHASFFWRVVNEDVHLLSHFSILKCILHGVQSCTCM
jgi:hypothetical protein